MLGSANGFVLSKWRFPGANVVFTLILFGMFIPYQSVMIPLMRLVINADLGFGDPHFDLDACGLRYSDHYLDLP